MNDSWISFDAFIRAPATLVESGCLNIFLCNVCLNSCIFFCVVSDVDLAKSIISIQLDECNQKSLLKLLPSALFHAVWKTTHKCQGSCRMLSNITKKALGATTVFHKSWGCMNKILEPSQCKVAPHCILEAKQPHCYYCMVL